MWLTMRGVAVLVFWGRARLGSIWFWTTLLIISAIAAPLIGEIGTPIGISRTLPLWLVSEMGRRVGREH